MLIEVPGYSPEEGGEASDEDRENKEDQERENAELTLLALRKRREAVLEAKKMLDNLVMDFKKEMAKVDDAAVKKVEPVSSEAAYVEAQVEAFSETPLSKIENELDFDLSTILKILNAQLERIDEQIAVLRRKIKAEKRPEDEDSTLAV